MPNSDRSAGFNPHVPAGNLATPVDDAQGIAPSRDTSGQAGPPHHAKRCRCGAVVLKRGDSFNAVINEHGATLHTRSRCRPMRSAMDWGAP